MATDAKKAVRVRFAPSPTGSFHVGGARTALFNWVFARQEGGVFVLRIEDTDKERSTKENEKEIFESLSWLGITWDEGPDIGGPYGPYRQSERMEIYKRSLEQLLHEGKAYYCYCTKEELEAEREAMVTQGQPPKYSGHCRNKTEPPPGKIPQLIRFKMPEVRVEFKDLVRGKVSFDANLFGDLVIAKSLEEPLYNFAVVVDDELMHISHVIRGEDLISNTPKQILIAKALGFSEPTYAHLPLILAKDRSKLSKRYAETSLLAYREQGYLPEAIVNFLILLGWHPKDTEEIFTSDKLANIFDIKRVQKAGAIFDEEKLLWLNKEHIKRAAPERLRVLVRETLGATTKDASDEFVDKVIAAERDRVKLITDFKDSASYFFGIPEYDSSLLIWKGESPPSAKEALDRIYGTLEALSDKEFIREKLMAALETLVGAGGKGSIFWPIRAALSGRSASADPITLLMVFGKEESLRRLQIAREKLNTLF
ncbi:MAG: glutamate--tRNA ligase [bacterium]|nr:glutamate--tRNA ligase [bacterium]